MRRVIFIDITHCWRQNETGSYSLFSNQHCLYHQRQELNFPTLLRYFSYRERNDVKIIHHSSLIITCWWNKQKQVNNLSYSYEDNRDGLFCYVKGFSTVHEHVHKFPEQYSPDNFIQNDFSFSCFSFTHSRIFLYLIPYYYLL